MPENEFATRFAALTGVQPFPWQAALFQRLLQGDIPSTADLPTGLGKTSVVALWLLALLQAPSLIPRRLVYVVNRRTVVDQTTSEVERLRARLIQSPQWVRQLQELCAIPVSQPLALSTLRGQHADNREWCADPARPAVIVGTVDMIGSGLLFSRYQAGFKTRPHHAALLGQDALLIHDEAHLEPAFQRVLEEVVREQRRSGDPRPLQVMALSATTRDAQPGFGLTPEDLADERVLRRLDASKHLVLVPLADEKQLAVELTRRALARRDSGRAVLVFARSVDVIRQVAQLMRKERVEPVVLTGTMRGKERDELASLEPGFLRFLAPSSRPADRPPPPEGTAYLLATSAGEVGVNLSADDLICDLSTYDSMAQRLGRVNRFGDSPGGAMIEVLHPPSFDLQKPVDLARFHTLELLRLLGGQASPAALRSLDPARRAAAFSPQPRLRPLTEIVLDAWAMTTLRGLLPGIPPVAPYLHGEDEEWDPPETFVAWRREVDEISGPLLEYYRPGELLEDFPLKPRELLRERSSRVREHLAWVMERLASRADARAEAQAWLIQPDGRVAVRPLSALVDKEAEAELRGCTLVLPPSAGGLARGGLLDGKAEAAGDGSEDVGDVEGVRCRVFQSQPRLAGELRAFRVARWFDLKRDVEEEGEDPARYWLWLENPAAVDQGRFRGPGESQQLEEHTRAVEVLAGRMVARLHIPEPLGRCVLLAARLHDAGKRRRQWQRGIGNEVPDRFLAKAGPELRPRSFEEPYRHEFGSVLDGQRDGCLSGLDDTERDLVLHLIAAHHGRARPVFPAEEVHDPEASFADCESAGLEVPRRFARLQRLHGRWGLAYLESILRAADYAASAGLAPSGGSPE